MKQMFLTKQNDPGAMTALVNVVLCMPLIWLF